MQKTTHLTIIPHATVLAWHSDDDVQAVRILTCEELYVDGRLIPLTEAHIHPTQQVINYCSVGKLARRRMRAAWSDLTKG